MSLISSSESIAKYPKEYWKHVVDLFWKNRPTSFRADRDPNRKIRIPILKGDHQ